MPQSLIDINQTNLTNVNQINIDDNIQTMSSVEIAELCGKQHKHVMRDIKKMLEEINALKFEAVDFTEPKFGLSDFSGVYKDSTGRSLPCYNLPKRECLILVSGYSTALRAKIIDRWQELDKENRFSKCFRKPSLR